MNKVINLKKNYEYSKQIKNVFNLISYKNIDPEIMGSNAMRFKYPSDYDLFTVIKSNKTLDGLKLEVKNEFINMMKDIKSKKDYIYFMEFMCGVDDKGEPLLWTIDEIIKGKKGDYNLINVLNEKSVIKIEIVAYLNSQFIPFSDVFHFQIGSIGINQEKITKDTIPSLSKEIKKYYDLKNYMKVLKRLFVISIVENKDILSKKLINIFQSDIGLIYKTKSDVSTIIKVLEKYNNKITIERIKNTMQILKDRLNTQTAIIFSKSFYDLFDKIETNNNTNIIMKKLKKIEQNLLNNVNKLVKKEIKLNKISFKKYL